MAFLKPKNVHGQTYWYVVESRRINGRVKTFNLAYLGKADDILTRWKQLSVPKDSLKSYNHSAVAVLLSLARRLSIAEIINTHIKAPRRGEQIERQIANILKGKLARQLFRYELTENKQKSG
jgi:hypothetical protein